MSFGEALLFSNADFGQVRNDWTPSEMRALLVQLSPTTKTATETTSQ